MTVNILHMYYIHNSNIKYIDFEPTHYIINLNVVSSSSCIGNLNQ